MDAENEKILEHLVGAGVLSRDEQATVLAAADIATRKGLPDSPGQANLLLCNHNWCLVVKKLASALSGQNMDLDRDVCCPAER